MNMRLEIELLKNDKDELLSDQIKTYQKNRKWKDIKNMVKLF